MQCREKKPPPAQVHGRLGYACVVVSSYFNRTIFLTCENDAVPLSAMADILYR